MRGGEVVTVAAGGGFGGKPRPALVIQEDTFQLSTVVVALFTTAQGKPGITRPRFQPTPENGLLNASDLMVDVLVTVRLTQVGGVIGRLTDEDMLLADRALIVFLGLAS